MGFNVAEIGDILDNYEDSAYVERAIVQKTKEVKEQMHEFQARLDKMEDMNALIDSGSHTESVEIIKKVIPSYPVITLRRILPDYGEQGNLWHQLFDIIDENKLHPVLSGQLLCIYHNQEFVEKNVDIEVCAVVKEPVEDKNGLVFRHTSEIPLAATAIFNGFYSEMALWEGIVAQWIEENGYEVVGCEQLYCLDHYLNCKDINQYRTEIQLPIKKI